MALIELRAAIDPALVESIDAGLLERGDTRWSLFEDVAARTARLVGIFPSQAEASAAWAALSSELAGLGPPEWRELEDADWREAYKLHFRPWHIARLHWVPVWLRGQYEIPPGDEVVWLDPGMAFGTGNHETTRLCVERLVAIAARQPRPRSVIDAGCGSGILALSAAKLGFGEVEGFDHDAEAVRIARENAALNGEAGRVLFRVGDLEGGFGGRRFDVVLANIQADVLLRHADALIGSVAPGGDLVLSGILGTEVGAVGRAFSDLAPGRRIDFRTCGDWADLQLS